MGATTTMLSQGWSGNRRNSNPAETVDSAMLTVSFPIRMEAKVFRGSARRSRTCFFPRPFIDSMSTGCSPNNAVSELEKNAEQHNRTMQSTAVETTAASTTGPEVPVDASADPCASHHNDSVIDHHQSGRTLGLATPCLRAQLGNWAGFGRFAQACAQTLPQLQSRRRGDGWVR